MILRNVSSSSGQRGVKGVYRPAAAKFHERSDSMNLHPGYPVRQNMVRQKECRKIRRIRGANALSRAPTSVADAMCDNGVPGLSSEAWELLCVSTSSRKITVSMTRLGIVDTRALGFGPQVLWRQKPEGSPEVSARAGAYNVYSSFECHENPDLHNETLGFRIMVPVQHPF